MDKLFEVMERPVGRGFRLALGIVLVYVGLVRLGGAGGHVLAVAGLLPIVMGLWGPCLVHLAVRRLRRT
jgi:hypothetical protein